MSVLAWSAFALAALAALMVFRNLRLYRPPPLLAAGCRPGAVSVLFPARDEEGSIGAALEAALATRGVDVEIIVLDDDSRDATTEIVAEIAARDPRVRLERGVALPEGWCGKQHACARLATFASHQTLLFVDADVRLGPDAVARAAAALERGGFALLSGFPRQIVGTPLERLLIPLVHFLLLAYLPMDGMRLTRMPGFGAGCGQFMMVRRDVYESLGGHHRIRASLHDGLRLPRVFRASGHPTGLVDLTDLASCRMYDNAGDVWRGLRKNAVEGIAARGVLGVMSTLLLVGQVLPFVLALLLLVVDPVDGRTVPVVLAACALVLVARLALTFRFRAPLSSALLHPVGVTVLLVIQWQARVRSWAGIGDSWKGRAYGPASRQDGS